jgi:hypothetical protein
MNSSGEGATVNTATPESPVLGGPLPAPPQTFSAIASSEEAEGVTETQPQKDAPLDVPPPNPAGYRAVLPDLAPRSDAR